jgi:hypothetical protein
MKVEMLNLKFCLNCLWGFCPWWSSQGIMLTAHHNLLRPRMVELYLQSQHMYMAWCLIEHNFTFMHGLY